MIKQLKLKRNLLLFLALLCSQLAYADKYYIDWNNVKLQAAQGVPAKAKHSYQIKGKLTLSKTRVKKGWFSTTSKNTLLASIWVSASGNWDQHKNTAEEKIILSGDQTGYITTVLKCNDDPWINQRPGCVVISTKMNSEMESISNWPEVLRKQLRPLTYQSVSLSEATRLSKINTPPPPPPPPPAGNSNPPPPPAPPPRPQPLSTPPTGHAIQGKSFKKVKKPILKVAPKKNLSLTNTVQQNTQIPASQNADDETVEYQNNKLKKRTKRLPKLRRKIPEAVEPAPVPDPKKDND